DQQEIAPFEVQRFGSFVPKGAGLGAVFAVGAVSAGRWLGWCEPRGNANRLVQERPLLEHQQSEIVESGDQPGSGNREAQPEKGGEPRGDGEPSRAEREGLRFA